MSKQKQVQGSLYSFFGGKQSSDDKEINTISETPAPNKKKTCKFQESWKDKYKWLSFVENFRIAKICNTP